MAEENQKQEEEVLEAETVEETSKNKKQNTKKTKTTAKKPSVQKFRLPSEAKNPDNNAQEVEYEEVDRVVQLQLRRVSHLLDRNNEIPEELKQNAMTRLGSALVGQQPVKGLTKREMDVLLPQVVDAEPGTPQFAAEKRNYFDEKTVNVGPSGVRLVVGKSVNNNIVPVEGYIEDYVTYRWAIAHPSVAENKDRAEKDPNKNYYIIDPEEDKEQRKVDSKVKKNAMLKYAEAVEDELLMDQLLKMFPENCPVSELYEMSSDDKELKLQEIADTKPERFLEAAEDDDLSIYAEIEEMVANNIITRDDTIYYYKDDFLGRGKDKVVAAFKSKEMASIVNSMRKQLEVERKTKGVD